MDTPSATAAAAHPLASVPYGAAFQWVTEYGVLAFVGGVITIGVIGLLLYLGYQWVHSNPFGKKEEKPVAGEAPTDRVVKKLIEHLSDPSLRPPTPQHGTTTGFQPAVTSGGYPGMRTPVPGTLQPPMSFQDHALFHDIRAALQFRIQHVTARDPLRQRLYCDVLTAYLTVYHDCIKSFIAATEADQARLCQPYPDPLIQTQAAQVVVDLHAKTVEHLTALRLPAPVRVAMARLVNGQIEQLACGAVPAMSSMLLSTNRERLGNFLAYCHSAYFFIYRETVPELRLVSRSLDGLSYAGGVFGASQAGDESSGYTTVPKE